MVQQLKSAVWFAVVGGFLLLLGGCAAGPSYNWGWYVLSPTQPRGLTNLEFLLGGLLPTILVSAAALAVSVPIGALIGIAGTSKHENHN